MAPGKDLLAEVLTSSSEAQAVARLAEAREAAATIHGYAEVDLTAKILSQLSHAQAAAEGQPGLQSLFQAAVHMIEAAQIVLSQEEQEEARKRAQEKLLGHAIRADEQQRQAVVAAQKAVAEPSAEMVAKAVLEVLSQNKDVVDHATVIEFQSRVHAGFQGQLERGIAVHGAAGAFTDIALEVVEVEAALLGASLGKAAEDTALGGVLAGKRAERRIAEDRVRAAGVILGEPSPHFDQADALLRIIIKDAYRKDSADRAREVEESGESLFNIFDDELAAPAVAVNKPRVSTANTAYEALVEKIIGLSAQHSRQHLLADLKAMQNGLFFKEQPLFDKDSFAVALQEKADALRAFVAGHQQTVAHYADIMTEARETVVGRIEEGIRAQNLETSFAEILGERGVQRCAPEESWTRRIASEPRGVQIFL